LTRITIWLALTGYAVSTALGLRRPGQRSVWARRFWNLGLACFLMHVAAAFHYYYEWSHAVGLAETARQTEELMGMASGSGLYLNYLFTLVWLADGIYWWMAGLKRHASRPLWVEWLVHVFFLFMIINGAVVFVSGPTRWLDVALLVGVGGAWWGSRRGWIRRSPVR
jgi:hypothetical protein